MQEQGIRAHSRPRPRGIRRDRDCQTCKLRDVKCDLNRPQCLPCKQAGLSCLGYPKRIKWINEGPKKSSLIPRANGSQRLHTRRKVSSVLSSKSAHPAQEVTECQKSIAPQESLEVYQNSCINRLANICSRLAASAESAQKNGSHISANSSQLVLYLYKFIQARIRGMSTSSALDKEGFGPLHALRYQLLAISGLHESLQTANPIAFVGILTLAVFEVYDGEYGEWQRHLYGAKSLLDHHRHQWAVLPGLSEKASSLIEIISWLVWFDTIGTIVRGDTELIFEDWHRRVVNQSFFAIVGCSADSFNLMVSVGKGVAASDPVGSCTMAMDQLIKVEPDETDWGRCTNMYRYAATVAVLTRLSQPSIHNTIYQGPLDSAVERMCGILASTSPSSNFYMHLALPAYLAGTNARTSKQCKIVRMYWTSCRLGGKQRYPGGLLQCEKKWAERGLD